MSGALKMLFGTFLLMISAHLTSQSLVFKNLTVNEGLSNNFVKSIYKDANGFIWIGTLEGLDRFDGSEVKSYSKKPGSLRESINVILQADKENLWIGTDAGLYQFNLKSESFSLFPLNKPGLKVLTLFKSQQNVIYAGTDNGVYIIDKKKKYTNVLIDKTPSSPYNSVTGITCTSNGDYWMATLGGLVKSGKDCIPVQRFYQPGGYNNLTLLDNKLYLGTKPKGLKCFDFSTQIFTNVEGFSADIVLALQNNGKDCIFAGTDGNGLRILNISNNKVTSISGPGNNPFSISSGSVYSFLCDKETYWIGTYSGGLNYNINAKTLFGVKTFDNTFLTYNRSIRSFWFSPSKEIIVGTRTGLYCYNGLSRKVREFTMSNTASLQSNIILTIFPFQNDYLIGTYGGGLSLFDFKKGTFNEFLKGEDFKSGSFYRIEEDAAGNLWMATLNGVYKYNPGTRESEHYTAETSNLPGNETYSLLIDSRSRIWVGTMKGVCILHPGEHKFDRSRLPSKFKNTFRVTFLYEDKKNNVWVCTEKGGLFCISPDLSHIENFTVNEGLPDNAVCAIIQDEKDDYWVSTLNGFCKISAKNKQIRSYNLSDGLPSMVFNPSAVYKSDNGQLIWGNEKGMVTFHPDSIIDELPDAPVVFTRFYLAGKEQEIDKDSPLKQSIETLSEIELSHTQNSVGFRFAALNYRNPQDNHFTCLMEGYDREWKILGNRDVVFYNNLTAGRYKLNVKLAGNRNPQNQAQILIVIKPSFFKTPYFFVLLLLLLSISAWWLYKRFEFLKERMRQTSLNINQSFKEKYKTSKVDADQSEKVRIGLEDYMISKRPYLNPNLKLSDVSHETGYSVHEISQVINQHMQSNFPDFINTYRIEECKKRMADDQYAKYTLTAIAEQCGFNSKTSFYRVFKKITQKTPAEYFKKSRLDLS